MSKLPPRLITITLPNGKLLKLNAEESLALHDIARERGVPVSKVVGDLIRAELKALDRIN